MAKLIPFSQHEAALLLDAYLNSVATGQPRLQAIKKVSADLRRLAINRSIEIDDVYRNVNGIHFQMASMESAYLGRTVQKPATKLFTKTVVLFRKNRDEYDKFLKEARSMVDGKIEKSDVAGEIEKEHEVLKIDFRQSTSLAYTRPLKVTYFEEDLHADTSWTDVYIKLMRALYEDYPAAIPVGKNFTGKGRIDFGNQVQAKSMTDPKNVYMSMYLETNLSASDIVGKIGALLDICHVDYENVAIYYEHKGSKKRTLNSSMPIVTLAENAKGSECARNESKFYAYLRDNAGMADATCRSYTSAIRSAEKYASERHFEYCRLYGCPAEETLMTATALFEDSEFIEYNVQQHNRFRAAINKLLECVGCESVKPLKSAKVLVDDNSSKRPENDLVLSRYKELLDKFFQKGFRMDSSLDMKKLRRFYFEQYETELTDEDGLVCQNIKTVAIFHDGKAYLPDSMLSQEKKDKLLQYIDDRFNAGCGAIYYGALFSEFEEIFRGERIYTPEMLKTYLSYINKGKYVLQRSYIAKDSSMQMNPEDEIREYLKESAGPVEVERLTSALSYIPEQKIKFALSRNSDFIWNATGEYFYEDCVHFSNSELEWISQFIEDGIEDRDFVTGNELVEAIEAHFPDIKELYQRITSVGMRNVIGYKLRDRFSFNGNIVSKYGEELSMAEVYAEYCHKHSRFTIDELNVLKQELGSTIYFDEIYAHSLRISQREFVSLDMAQFDVEATDEAIARICTGQYMSLQEIRDFGTFPYAGYPWNEYLVEVFVANYSQKFRLLHIGYSANVCAGAIVKQASPIQNFNDLLIDVLANSDIALNEDSALEYLRQQGYMARRRYSEIGRILTEAKVVRSKKG